MLVICVVTQKLLYYSVFLLAASLCFAGNFHVYAINALLRMQKRKLGLNR